MTYRPSVASSVSAIIRVVVQAIAVGALAELQYIGLRRSSGALAA
jgi:hypothetical protein